MRKRHVVALVTATLVALTTVLGAGGTAYASAIPRKVSGSTRAAVLRPVRAGAAATSRLAQTSTGSAAGRSYKGSSTQHGTAKAPVLPAVKGAVAVSVKPHEPVLPKPGAAKPTVSIVPSPKVSAADKEKTQTLQTLQTLQAAVAAVALTPTTGEDISERTATSSTVINPDGTRTSTIASRPIHRKDSTGKWVDINTTLASTGGRLAASSTDVAASFAANATDKTLARLQLDASTSAGYTLPGAALNAPTVSKNVATYQNIEPDADLRLQANNNGFKESLILKSPAAPRTWTFRLQLQGLTASLDTAGDVQLRNSSDSKLRAVIPHGFMEDSNYDPHAGQGALSRGVTYKLITLADGTAGLQLTLDSRWLDDPARKYPVTVDPTTLAITGDISDGSDDTYVMSNAPGNNSTATDMHVGTYDGGTHVGAGYMNFNVGYLAYSHILSAQLSLWENWSWSCSPRSVSIYQVTQPWSGSTSTTWPGPAYGTKVATGSFAMGYSSSCPAGYNTFKSQTLLNLLNGCDGAQLKLPSSAH